MGSGWPRRSTRGWGWGTRCSWFSRSFRSGGPRTSSFSRKSSRTSPRIGRGWTPPWGSRPWTSSYPGGGHGRTACEHPFEKTSKLRETSKFFSKNFSLSALFTFFVVSFSHYLGCLSKSSWTRWISRGAGPGPNSTGSTPSPTPGDASTTAPSTPTARTTSTATWNRSEGFHRHGHQIARQFWLCRRRRFLPDFCG